MNSVLDRILAMIKENELYQDFKLVHSNNGEIRFLYHTFIIIIRYDGDKILAVNGFKTFEKYFMDKLENCDWFNEPHFKNHYKHHDSHHHHSHHHDHEWCKTVPACNNEYQFNSDVMQKPRPDFTMLHDSLDNYREYIKNDLTYVNTVICFIDCIVAMRNDQPCPECKGVGDMEEKDPIWNEEKKDYTTRVEFLASQKVQDDRIDNLEENQGGITEETDPVWQREKGDYTTKAEFQASQKVQDDRIKALEDNPGGGGPEQDPIWNEEKVNYYKKDETLSKKEIEDSLAPIATGLGSAQGDITLLKQKDEEQDKRLTKLEENPPTGEEKDPIWQAEKGEYRKSADQDVIDTGINNSIGAISSDVENLKLIKVSKEDFDASQKVQDDRIQKLEDNPGGEETDPVWNAEKKDYRKVVDQDNIDNILRTDIDKNTSDIIDLQERDVVAPYARAYIKEQGVATDNIDNLVNFDPSKFYANGNVFEGLENNIINNDDGPSEETNQMILEGAIPISATSAVGEVNVTISTLNELNNVTFTQTINLEANQTHVMPFTFMMAGTNSNIELYIKASGTSNDNLILINPGYITITKIKW